MPPAYLDILVNFIREKHACRAETSGGGNQTKANGRQEAQPPSC
jgi:hypothetical protein